MKIERDKFCLKLLQDPNHKEARAWLNESESNDRRVIGELDSQESISVVNGLYQAGAKYIHAVKIEPGYFGGEGTSTLVVELPDDARKRSKLFEIEGRHAEEMGFDPTEDEGQKYLFFFWS
jgi:hypothetical protein